MGLGTERTTIYVSNVDKAIGFSAFLFTSLSRIGQLRPEDLTDEQRQHLERVARTQLIDARVPTCRAMRTSIAIRRSVPIWSVVAGPARARARASPYTSVGEFLADHPDYPGVSGTPGR